MRLLVAPQLLLLAACATASLAQTSQLPPTVTVVTPVFHQLVAFSLPSSFNLPAPDHGNARFYIHEFPLRGETVEQWTQLFTLTGANGGATTEPAAALQRAAAGYQRACPQTFAMRAIPPAELRGLTGAAAVISCGSVPDEHGKPGAVHSETALYLVLNGAADQYTLQWAERAEASSTPLAIPAERWLSRLRTIQPVRICNRVPGEQAPYPSCVGK